MKQKSAYNLGEKKDAKVFEHVIEELYQNREKLLGKCITWEKLTEDYFLLPCPSDDLTRLSWVSRRSYWCKILNKKFLEKNYRCYLDVKSTIGVYLLEDIDVIVKITNQRTKKITNSQKNAVVQFNDYKNKGCYPEAEQILIDYIRVCEDNQHAFFSRIANSALPTEMKRELRKIAKKGIV